MWRRSALAVAAAAAVSACGAASSPSPAASHRATPTPDVGATALTATVRPDPDGAHLDLSIVVIGPATLHGGCVAAVPAVLLSASGQQLGSAEPSLQGGLACQAIIVYHVAAGQQQQFLEFLPRPLAAGTYRVVCTLGDTTATVDTALPAPTPTGY